MEESEKMTALKKAYAEIILNTAKEAAARIMASERKAHQFQHDLSSTKEEALRLLLRLKQTMDSKITEAEMKSLCQQKRIDELEAQLQEAEDIVSNLRSDLNEAHMRLEEMAMTQKQDAPEMTRKAVCEEEEAAQHVNVVSQETVLAPQENYLRNGANGHGAANNPLEEYGYTGVPEVPPIIVRSKEPELYRNGCTQRIRAYEGNLLNGHFSLSDERKNEKMMREDQGERVYMTTPLASEFTCRVEDKPVEIKEVKNVGKASYKVSSLLHRKRKRGARYRRSNASALKCIPPLMAKEALTALSNSPTCLTNSNGMLGSFDGEDKDKQSLSPSIAPCNVAEIDAPNERKADAQGEDEDREVANSLVLIREQSVSGDCLDAPSSTPQVELENVPSVNMDSEVSEKVDGIPSPPAKERVLKYTFQRKRKKESLSSDNSSSLNQENSLKRKMGKKQNGSVETPKSSAAIESSRDSRRMAQVARQLISLSEKKWWK